MGEQEGRYDFTSCLEQHREQEHHAAKGCGVDLPAEHLRTSGDHPGILHEELHQRPGIQAEDEGQRHGDGDEEGQTEADELAHHVPLFCAVQVTEQWDAAEREAYQNQLGDHAHLAGNAHGGNFVGCRRARGTWFTTMTVRFCIMLLSAAVTPTPKLLRSCP